MKMGGGEAVCVWFMQALVDKYNVTLFTNGDFNISELNEYFGTNLKRADFKVNKLNLPWFLDKSFTLEMTKIAIAMRTIKRQKSNFDLIVSTFGEMDFGWQGIQYIHYPRWSRDFLLQYTDLGRRSSWYRIVHYLYHKICAYITHFNNDAVRNNLTLVNSEWTGKRFKKTYNAEYIIVYPPIQNDFEQIPWDKRENGFVCLSRLSSDKRILDTISIITRLKYKGYNVHLHIIGPTYKDDYVQRIKDKVSNCSYIKLEGKTSREKLCSIISRHKYGIHSARNEHFGIAVAELVLAGCIPFAHDSGGPKEILRNTNLLLFKDKEEAIDKISLVLDNRQLQLLSGLRKNSTRFTKQSFQRKILKIITDYLTEGGYKWQ